MIKSYEKDKESSIEYSLADYMGDVKKILSVTASAVPSGKFRGESTAEFSGIVSYDILYSDSEGKLTNINTSSDFDFSVPVDNEKYIDSMIDTKVASVSVRLTGPRKLIAKAVVASSVKISEEEDLGVVGDAFSDGRAVETLSEEVKVERAVFGASAEREYAEEAERIEGVRAEDVEVLATSGVVRILESLAVDGGVSVRGEIIVTSIVRTEEQPPFAIRKTIPFEEKIEFDLDGINGISSAVANLTSVSSAVVDEEEASVITVSAVTELSAMLAENREVSITKDAYLVDRDTVSRHEDYRYTSLVCMDTKSEEVKLVLNREELGFENVRNILVMSGEARAVETEGRESGFNILGDIAFSGIACEINEDNTVNYIPIKFTSPFKLDVNCGCQIPENSEIEAALTVPMLETGLDAEKMTVKCTLDVKYRVICKNTVKRLVECSVSGDTEYKSSSSVVTVYYPESNETLFDVAKKFHTTTLKIANDNNLSEPSSSIPTPLKRLIIR